MFSVATKTVVTFDTDSLYSTLRRFVGEDYNIDIHHNDGYTYVDIQFDNTVVQSSDIQLLYDYLKNLYAPILNTTDIVGGLESTFGFDMAHKYKVVIEDELSTLDTIRKLLGANPKYDNNFICIYRSAYDTTDIITICVKCDEWIDF